MKFQTPRKATLIGTALAVCGLGVVAAVAAFGGHSGPQAVPPVWQPGSSESAAAPVPEAAPRVKQRTVTETEPIAFTSRTVKDTWLPKGTKEPRTTGVDGVRTKTYAVTLVGGRETKRKLIKSEVTREPVPAVVAIGTNTGPDDTLNR